MHSVDEHKATSSFFYFYVMIPRKYMERWSKVYTIQAIKCIKYFFLIFKRWKANCYWWIYFPLLYFISPKTLKLDVLLLYFFLSFRISTCIHFFDCSRHSMRIYIYRYLCMVYMYVYKNGMYNMYIIWHTAKGEREGRRRWRGQITWT